MPDGEEEHVCEWSRKFLLLADEHLQLQRQLKASDHRNRRMASNCNERTANYLCAIDANNKCKTQCGDPGATRQNGVLTVHARRS